MNQLKKVNSSLIETIKNSDLQKIAVNLSEIGIDSLLDDGLLKSIPVLGTIIGLGKTTNNIKDFLFLKKIIHFLSELTNIPKPQRRMMVNKINDSKEFNIKVGEKLIYVIEKCDDYIDAQYVGKLFCAFIQEQITYNEFLKASRIIQQIFLKDLKDFLAKDADIIEGEFSQEEAPNEEDFIFINHGLLAYSSNPIQIDYEQHADDFEKYQTTGGEVVMWITEIGKTLRKIINKEKL